MDPVSCVKMVALAASQYLQNQNENTKSQLIRHLEVLLAHVKTVDDIDCVFKNDAISKECICSLVCVIATQNKDNLIVHKIFNLFTIILKIPLSHMYFESTNINLALIEYAVQNIDPVHTNYLQECLSLLEETTYKFKVLDSSNCVDQFLSYLLQQVELDSGNLSSSCLGILSNFVANNLAIQSQVKGMLSVSKIKGLMNYLRQDSIPNRICVLSIVTYVCWDDEFAKKLYSVKNVTQTIKLLFSEMCSSDELLTQHRAADLCVELLKRGEIVEQFSIYESEHNCTSRLLIILQKNLHPSAASKVLDALLAFCQISTVRHNLCLKMFDCNQTWEILLNTASQNLIKSDHQPSIKALILIKELCDEVVDLNLDLSETSWFLSLLSLLTQLLVVSETQETGFSANLFENFKLTKQLQCIKILNCFSVDKNVASTIVKHINAESWYQLIDFQLTHNPMGTRQPLEWSNIGAKVVLSLLQVMLYLKPISSDLEQLLYSSLQDTRLVPFLAHAMTGCDRIELQIALRLHQEALPLPDFPSLLLAETMCYLNERESAVLPSSYTGLLPLNCNSFKGGTLQHSALVNSSKPSKFPLDQVPSPPNNRANADQCDDKENVNTLIESIKNIGGEVKLDDVNPPQNMSKLVEIYENKLSSLTISKTHLEDLLEAKTLALSQADRIISQNRLQLARCEQDAKKLADILHESEKRSEGLIDRFRAAECDRSSMERELQTVVEENRNLQKVADQYDGLQNAFQDISHKNEVLERNLNTSRQEYDTLKELHDMIQKHSEKIKLQHSQATARLEDIEEERLKLLKRVSQLESSVSDLTQLVEEQDRAAQVLMHEKAERDATIKSMKQQIAKREEAIKELKIKVSTQENSKQQVEHQLKERTSEIKKLNKQIDSLHRKIESSKVEISKVNQIVDDKEEEVNTLKQKLEKQAQTLLMITELSNNIRGSQ